MGFFDRFSSKDKAKERFLGAKLSESRYSSLEELVIGEVGLNSADSKLITITFSDEKDIKIWVTEDKIIAASFSERPIELREFLYWFEASEGTKSVLISEIGILTPDALPSVSSLAPQVFDTIVSYIADYMNESLKWANENFDSYLTVDTEIFKLPRVIGALTPRGIRTGELTSSLFAIAEQEEQTAKLIGIAGVDRSKVLFAINNLTTPVTPEEKVIVSAAQSASNLEETIELANGFSTSKLLNTAFQLAENDVIDISIASDATWELPELSEMPLKPYENIFIPTSLGEDITELSEQVFAQSSWLDSIRAMVSDNNALERRIAEIEEKLIKLLAEESFAEFADLPEDAQSSIRLLLNEREAHSEKRHELLSSIKSQILVQQYEIDEKLDGLIDTKLEGIEEAAVKIELVTPAFEIENDFDLDEHAPEFNFNDGVIETNDDGETFIREIETTDDAAEAQVKEQFFDSDSNVAERMLDFDSLYGGLSKIEKAGLGVQKIPAKGDTLPPIFLRVAEELGVDPLALVKR